MKNITSFLLLFFFTLSSFKYSKAQIPHLTGTVDVSVNDGSFKCTFLLTNMPVLKKYTIRLNSGFNVAYFRDSSNKLNYGFEKYFDSKESYEAFQYTLPDSDSTTFLPTAYRIKYTGSFPVINDTNTMYNRGDWKGNIAFNGKTVRASEQTAWYPILYDALNDVTIDKYTYNIKVTCKDAETIYINGDSPKKGISNNFISTEPVALLLYAGNYNFTTVSGINFINSPLSQPQHLLLAANTNGIIKFYEEQLQIKYGKKVNYIATTPVSKNNGWMFVTYPSIFVIGNKNLWDINNLFTTGKTLSVDTANIQSISHELGHYYFGTLFTPNSTLRWMFLEGITEYLSLQYARNNFGIKVYQQSLDDYIKTVKSFGKIIPISKIKNSNNIGEGYRYYYIPLLLTALEKKIGLPKIWSWFSAMVNDKNVTTDYAYFKNSLLKNGMLESDFNSFETTFINDENAIENVINLVSK